MGGRLGVALVPRADCLRAAVEVQRGVGGGEVLTPVLSADGNLPHVTLLQCSFVEGFAPEGELRRILRAVRLPREIRLGSPGVVHRPGGWVFLELERSPLLVRLQEAVLATLEPSIDRGAIDMTRDTSDYPEIERVSRERYGYRYTGDAFGPHITLGRADEEVAREMVRRAPERTSVPGSWVFDRMTFYVIGEHGCHERTLAWTALAPDHPDEVTPGTARS